MSWESIDEAPRPEATAEPALPDEVIRTDIAIIGSGMGGGTMAYALKDSGAKILIIERGHRLPAEPQNSDLDEVYLKGRYKNADNWDNGRTGAHFKPGVYYWVGGNTKVYGACLPRFRASDFEETAHHDGVSPAWPFSYADVEPFYARAEELFEVRGQIGEDPTEPVHSEAFPLPPLGHEPAVRDGCRTLPPARAAPVPHGQRHGRGQRSSARSTPPRRRPPRGRARSPTPRISPSTRTQSGRRYVMIDTYVRRFTPAADGRTVVAPGGTQ